MSLSKRSLTLHGHRTSLALEPEFWSALEDIAASERVSLPMLVARIDDGRQLDPATMPPSLSSALRVAALNHFRKSDSDPAP